MKIMITGANGMLGYELCSQLCRLGVSVVATSRGESRLTQLHQNTNFAYKTLDITSKEEVSQCIESILPDVIIHAAAMTQVDDCEINKRHCLSVNVDGTKNLLTAADEYNCRFIYISTDFVFNGEHGPYSEGDSTEPVNFYGQSKLLAEELVMQSDLPWTIIRTVLLYGKTDNINRTNFIYWVKENLEAGKSIQVVTDQIRTPTFIPDLAQGIVRVILQSSEGIFHISGDEVLTPYGLGVLVAEQLNLNKKLIHPVYAAIFSQPGKRPLKTGFIIDKAKKLLNFQPTPIKQAIRQIFELQ